MLEIVECGAGATQFGVDVATNAVSLQADGAVVADLFEGTEQDKDVEVAFIDELNGRRSSLTGWQSAAATDVGCSEVGVHGCQCVHNVAVPECIPVVGVERNAEGGMCALLADADGVKVAFEPKIYVWVEDNGVAMGLREVADAVYDDHGVVIEVGSALVLTGCSRIDGQLDGGAHWDALDQGHGVLNLVRVVDVEHEVHAVDGKFVVVCDPREPVDILGGSLAPDSQVGTGIPELAEHLAPRIKVIAPKCGVKKRIHGIELRHEVSFLWWRRA